MHGDRVVGRARRVRDAGSRFGGEDRAVGRLQREVRPLAVRASRLEPGQLVLDVGCGTGHAFPALYGEVGGTGRIVGVDVSPRMLARARAEAGRRGWDAVELHEADVSSADLGRDRFDAALASFSPSTVPDLAAAIDRVHAALRPGGRLFVVDAHFRPGLPRLARLLYRGLTGADGDDVPAALRARFARVEPVYSTQRTPLPYGEVAWPPAAAALATKAASVDPP